MEETKFHVVGADGREFGPVTAEILREWAREGRLLPSAQARRDGEAAWWAAEHLPELAGTFAVNRGSTAPAGPPIGYPLPPVPRLQESPYPALREEWARDDYEVRVGAWMKAGWRVYWRFFLLIVGCMFLVGVAQFVIGSLPFGIGTVMGLVLHGVWVGGFMWFLLKLIRVPQMRRVGDVFAGFQRGFGSLVASQLLITLFKMLANVPLWVAGAMFIHWLTSVGVAEVQLIWDLISQMTSNPAQADGAAAQLQGVMEKIWAHIVERLERQQFWILLWLILLGILVLPAVVVQMLYMFTFPLIVDHRFEFWEAMECSRKVVGKHWFLMTTFAALWLPIIVLTAVSSGALGGFGICFLMGLPFAGQWVGLPYVIGALGAVLGAMGGLLFSVPYCRCATAAVYEDIFHGQRKFPSAGVDKPAVGG